METINAFTDCEGKNLMTADKVHWFLDLFDELDIKVWIDGGWGVDALLGECTREHQDLDIIVDPVITYTLSIGAVRKPHLPGIGSVYLFLEFTISSHGKIRQYSLRHFSPAVSLTSTPMTVRIETSSWDTDCTGKLIFM